MSRGVVVMVTLVSWLLENAMRMMIVKMLKMVNAAIHIAFMARQ